MNYLTNPDMLAAGQPVSPAVTGHRGFCVEKNISGVWRVVGSRMLVWKALIYLVLFLLLQSSLLPKMPPVLGRLTGSKPAIQLSSRVAQLPN